MAVFMPMTFPSMFSSGPPELPGLIEASVWMKSVNVRPASFDGTERPSAETTPVVTEPLSPNGLPTATTFSPIIRSDDVPIGIDADQRRRELRAVVEVDGDVRRPFDDVIVRDDDAVG